MPAQLLDGRQVAKRIRDGLREARSHVARVQGDEADPLEPIELLEPAQEVSERGAPLTTCPLSVTRPRLRKVLTVGVHGLTEEGVQQLGYGGSEVVVHSFFGDAAKMEQQCHQIGLDNEGYVTVDSSQVVRDPRTGHVTGWC